MEWLETTVGVYHLPWVDRISNVMWSTKPMFTVSVAFAFMRLDWLGSNVLNCLFVDAQIIRGTATKLFCWFRRTQYAVKNPLCRQLNDVPIKNPAYFLFDNEQQSLFLMIRILLFRLLSKRPYCISGSYSSALISWWLCREYFLGGGVKSQMIMYHYCSRLVFPVCVQYPFGWGDSC